MQSTSKQSVLIPGDQIMLHLPVWMCTPPYLQEITHLIHLGFPGSLSFLSCWQPRCKVMCLYLVFAIPAEGPLIASFWWQQVFSYVHIWFFTLYCEINPVWNASSLNGPRILPVKYSEYPVCTWEVSSTSQITTLPLVVQNKPCVFQGSPWRNQFLPAQDLPLFLCSHRENSCFIHH